MKKNFIIFFLLLIVISVNSQQKGDPKISEIWSPVPKVISPGKVAAGAPSDAIILYGEKKDSLNWVNKDGNPFNWKAEDNSLTVVPFSGDLRTKIACVRAP